MLIVMILMRKMDSRLSSLKVHKKKFDEFFIMNIKYEIGKISFYDFHSSFEILFEANFKETCRK